MKNNTRNNTNAMVLTNDALQAIIAGAVANAMQAGIAQGARMVQAQEKQAQAMGAGDAGKALPVQGKAQGKGKAQAKQAQEQGIAWKRIERQNERQTVYDVRQAMVHDDMQGMASLVKAWIALNEKEAPNDARVLKVCDDMCRACFHAKGMKVKGADNAHFEVASMVTVKRAFYCAMRGMPIVETRDDARPETRGKKAQGK